MISNKVKELSMIAILHNDANLSLVRFNDFLDLHNVWVTLQLAECVYLVIQFLLKFIRKMHFLNYFHSILFPCIVIDSHYK